MIDKFTTPWASGGDTGTAPTAEKQATGHVRREKAVRQLFNWLWNKSQTKINDLVDACTNSYDQSAAREFDLASGLWTEAWGNPSNTNQNRFDVGSGTTIEMMRPCFIDGVPYILALDTAGSEIHLINARTGVIADSSGNLAAEITGTATAQAFCTDNEYVYVVFSNTGNAVYVQRFLISSWEPDPAWTNGGELLSGTWSACVPQIKVVKSTHVAVACPWVSIANSNSAAIQVLAISDGGITAAGAGDSSATAGTNATGEFASDGTNIFFVTEGTTPEICSCTIALATAGTGGTGYPLTIIDDRKMCGIGNTVISVANTSTGSSTPVVQHSAANAIKNGLVEGTADSGDDAVDAFFGGAKDLVFDGINLWICTPVRVDGSSNWRMAMLAIDAAYFHDYAVGSMTNAQYMTSVIRGPSFLPIAFEEDTRITFDGRDIWACTGGRYLYRLPLAFRR